MGVTIADVARAAGVGKATASRALSGHGHVRPDTAAHVAAVAERLGFVASRRAVNLVNGTSRLLAVRLPSTRTAWAHDILDGIIASASAKQFGVLVSTEDGTGPGSGDLIDDARAGWFDGLIVVDTRDSVFASMEPPYPGFPVVLLGGVPGTRPAQVTTTDREGAADAARHLLELGRVHLAMISGPSSLPAMRARSDGFTSAADLGGRPLSPRLVAESDLTEAGGYAACRRLIERAVPFDGLFAHNDLSAIGAMRALAESGRRVPADVAVIGFDDIPAADLVTPRLSTVAQPGAAMGGAAAEMLLAMLTGQAAPAAPVVVSTTLIPRTSTLGNLNLEDTSR